MIFEIRKCIIGYYIQTFSIRDFFILSYFSYNMNKAIGFFVS